MSEMGYIDRPSDSIRYTVQQGDTLHSLAESFETTVKAILDANSNITADNLQAGQIIIIPFPPFFYFCPPGTFRYIVRPGDTLFSLAARYNTTVAAILAVNPGLDPRFLRVGQRICIPRVTPPVPPPVFCPPGTFTYVVRPGDTLFILAGRYNTTVAAIIAANPGVDLTPLRVGQRICIPRVTPPVPPPGVCPPNTFVYVVQPGDTLFSIAARFNVTVAAILAVNPGITDPNFIFVGQRICIPRVTPPVPPPGVCPPNTFVYVVQPGDTLFSIAARFNVTVAAILAVNPGITDPNFIFVGQRICIPAVPTPF